MAIDPALHQALASFYEIVDARTVQLERARPELLCPENCSLCCVGNIFLVTALDFAYVCHYVTQHLDGDEKARIIDTAEGQVAQCGVDLAERLEASSERFDSLPGQRCPLLSAGRCRVYPARPTPCRLFGRTRFASGRLNVCDIIHDRLPAGGNGNPRDGRAPRLPVVEDYSRMLATMLKKRLGSDLLARAERLLHVATIPVFIASTRFDEDRVLEATV